MKRKNADMNILEGIDKLEMFHPETLLEWRGGFMDLPSNVKSALTRLRELTNQYKSELKILQDAELDVKQEWIIAEPNVYVARTRDIKTEREYFTAKAFWPLKNGEKKEVKIYLGRAEDFGNDTMSIKAREFAKRKMSETLRRRKDDGEI